MGHATFGKQFRLRQLREAELQAAGTVDDRPRCRFEVLQGSLHGFGEGGLPSRHVGGDAVHNQGIGRDRLRVADHTDCRAPLAKGLRQRSDPNGDVSKDANAHESRGLTATTS